jgi:hypothetical protein
MKTDISFILSRTVLVRMRNVSDKRCTENQNTHFSLNFFSRKSCRLWDNVQKYCRAGQDTDNNMAHVHCMLYTSGNRHTLRICNTYYFSAASMVVRTRSNVMLYVYCLKLFRCNMPWLIYRQYVVNFPQLSSKLTTAIPRQFHLTLLENTRQSSC